MPPPNRRIASLPPFSHTSRRSLDDSALPTLPHPPSPPPTTTNSSTTPRVPLISNPNRYTALPLISTVTAAGPTAQTMGATGNDTPPFEYSNSNNTGVYSSLSRIPSYRLPSPISLPSRHDSRIQRDRGMSTSPVSSISAMDAPVTSRYSYLMQPLPEIPQQEQQQQREDTTTPDLPAPPPPPASVPSAASQAYNNSFLFPPPPRVSGQNPQLTPIIEASPAPQSDHAYPSYFPDQPPQSRGEASTQPNGTQQFQTPSRNFNPFSNIRGRLPSFTPRQRQVRPMSSFTQLIRRQRGPEGLEPAPALAILGLVTSFLVFIALMTFLWFSPFAANIVAIVYTFAIFAACLTVLILFYRNLGRPETGNDGMLSILIGGSRWRRRGVPGPTVAGHPIFHQPEMVVDEGEVIVVPRMPVHRAAGEGEADPDLPPYTRASGTA